MPKHNQLLKYVKIDPRTGRLTYRRQIPAQLRPYLGGKCSIRRTLSTESTDCRSTSVLTAYAKVHSEVDGLIEQARSRAEDNNALIQGRSQAITAPDAHLPLSRREIAGIAGQVLLDIRNAAADQRLMTPEYGRRVIALAIKMKTQGISRVTDADFAVMARPVLDQLQINPSPADMTAIGQALMAYVPVMATDMQKLSDMNFSPPQLEAIAPPLPKRSVSWKQLFDLWLRNAGGVLQQDGYGVSEASIGVYQSIIREIRRYFPNIPPDKLTSANARSYVEALENESSIAVSTKQKKVICLNTLYKLAVVKGILQTNPFSGLQIKAPAGATEQLSYRPFTDEEIIGIFTAAKAIRTEHERLVYYLLICTGARLSEVLQLRTHDLKKTSTGVWFFDWRHEPTAPLPVLLKSKSKNNRQTPLHPLLMSKGIVEMKTQNQQRLLGEQNIAATCKYSQRFAQLLKDIEIYERKKTVLHSFRGTAKDHWRRAGISEDMRLALTGHTSRNVGESSYGEGLQSMPDITFAKLKEVDLSWLP